ncbi:dTDP-4-dehydrorhamnose 3,5-epimerase [Aliifodinibius salipaludis]|uniref:dTDP-4-dehydrorhamnose 3,5-epimerase n=1 Tax=Fodinibius salipaludis TaxID=2032627 RepID=A0A2A2GB19_9BACT|nr:dTDP-4-dehydrorhamnose 3,5-epimerase [Aliifodinibius salipaludis]PAU94012.1 dTDP-4-dehydrorhamnose 3,5-epimerase [Aliifodinibius salipaludis]
MIFNETELNDAFVIDLKKLGDERGFFARAFCVNEFKEQGIEFSVAQANVSYNRYKHTLRGMHYQEEPYGEAKLVRCTRGAIWDAIIDVRPDSSTYMQWIGVELTEQNYRMLYIPEGFAHGFITLEDETEVTYQVSEFYTPGAEKGIRWDDQSFNIDWPADPKIMSEKDKSWSDFKKIMRT